MINVVYKSNNIESFNYLMSKRRSKGREIIYKSIQTADYLMPNSVIKNISEKQLVFALRNKTLKISDSYTVKELCICYTEEDLAHIYECNLLNKKKIEISYDKIYNGTLIEQHYIINRMKENLNNRKQWKENTSSM